MNTTTLFPALLVMPCMTMMVIVGLNQLLLQTAANLAVIRARVPSFR